MFDLSTVSVFYENVERRIGRYQDVEWTKLKKRNKKKKKRKRRKKGKGGLKRKTVRNSYNYKMKYITYKTLIEKYYIILKMNYSNI